MNALDLQQCRAALDHEAFSGEFSLRRLDPEGDLDLMHSWMNDPKWRASGASRGHGPRRSYLFDQHCSAHSVPYLGLLDGAPISYWGSTVPIWIRSPATTPRASTMPACTVC
ncbi:hypothetical protein I551_8974 [Mycobacterium ulcerans str. Harvey]|uniref:Lysine N-acyltransferase MbtK n=1 Tax=Mycobacterium ulcerans str. Harvey TaxID=1299332 RepID=A0ABN0R9K3_MYCUL|nr:hypothetical protein I551_8974 [Mycobacterium ulcerans str. Harvey]